MSDLLFCDFETRSRIDLKKAGADVYARHESTRAMAFGFAFNDEPIYICKMGEKPPDRVIRHIENGGITVAHNVPFEWVIWNFVYRREFSDLPWLEISQMVCTMAMGYSMALPGQLANIAPALGLTAEKDMEGNRITLQLAVPKSDDTFHEPEQVPEKFERMYSYCKDDIEVERQAFKRLLKLSPKERELWLLDHRINQRGVQINMKAIQAAIDIVELEKKEFNLRMQAITENAVATCNANTQLQNWLLSKGVLCDGLAKNDVVDLLLDQELLPECREALELRQMAAKSSTAKLPAIINGVCDDGRVRGLFQYHGASTGRWAGRRIQLQNLPRPILDQESVENIFRILEEVS